MYVCDVRVCIHTCVCLQVPLTETSRLGAATHSPAYTWAFRSPCVHPVHPGQPPPQHSMGAWWRC